MALLLSLGGTVALFLPFVPVDGKTLHAGAYMIAVVTTGYLAAIVLLSRERTAIYAVED